MTIINDTVVFTADDFADLSAFARKALAAFPGSRNDFIQEFGNKLNLEIFVAKAHLRNVVQADPDVAALVNSLAQADEAKRAEVQPLLEQLKGSFLPGKTVLRK